MHNTSTISSPPKNHPILVQKPPKSHTPHHYSFNGMERDDEIKGVGNSLDFGARIYDVRIGRWLARDPRERDYVPLSPYHFCLNSPIKLVDVDGKLIVDSEGVEVTWSENKDGTLTFSDNASTLTKLLIYELYLGGEAGKMVLNTINQDEVKFNIEKFTETTETGLGLDDDNGALADKRRVTLVKKESEYLASRGNREKGWWEKRQALRKEIKKLKSQLDDNKSSNERTLMIRIKNREMNSISLTILHEAIHAEQVANGDEFDFSKDYHEREHEEEAFTKSTKIWSNQAQNEKKTENKKAFKARKKLYKQLKKGK